MNPKIWEEPGCNLTNLPLAANLEPMSLWKTLQSKVLFKSGVIKLRTDECELPDGRVMPNYYVLEFPDWVNVVAIDDKGDLILVRQFRHAAGESFLEVPGGSTDGSFKEDPRKAAERELIEETGYQSKEWVYCGFHFPNPALQNNKMHTYLALNCIRVSEQNLDPFEDLTVEKIPLKQGVEMWQKGELKHSIISASLAISMSHLKGRGLI